MPADYRIDRSANLVLSRAWGVVTDQDLVDNRVALFTDSAFTPDLSQIYDFTDATEIKVTSAGVLSLAQTSQFSPTARRAIVVATDVAFGMARMYAMMSDREGLRVFRDRASATQWLTSDGG